MINPDRLTVKSAEALNDPWGRPFVLKIPGEKNMNSDFEVHSRVCRIIGARISEGETT